MKVLLKILSCLFFLTSALGLKAAPIITARMDSVSILMGKLGNIRLQVITEKNQAGRLSLFDEAERSKGYIGICSDSVELSSEIRIDTVEREGNRIQIDYDIPFQAFDSGTYTLPPFIYIAGKDSARSNELSFSVVPVKVTAEDQIAPYAPPMEPEGKRFYDFVPDWILDFWWIFLVIVFAIIAFMWGMNRFKKTGTILPSKPQPTPYEIAISELKALKEKKLWEQGHEKEYFTDLTDILRTYLFGRFGINAMEMTSRQIIERLNNSDVKDKKEYIRQILSVADFVKFAKVRPLPADNIGAFENAVKFVEETKPEVVSETNDLQPEKEKGGEA